MQSFRELIVWPRAMEGVVKIYRITARFPKYETYGLANHLQRAAVSVSSNLSEGDALKQTKSYLRHLALAGGSLAELERQLEISHRLNYLLPEARQAIAKAQEVGRMLMGLGCSLKDRPNT